VAAASPTVVPRTRRKRKRLILMVLGGAYTLVFRTMEFGWCEERDDRLWSI
jgi:hypothetical protein